MIKEAWEIVADCGAFGLFTSEKEALEFAHEMGYRYMTDESYNGRVFLDCYLEESLTGKSITITNLRISDKMDCNFYDYVIEKNRHLLAPGKREELKSA